MEEKQYGPLGQQVYSVLRHADQERGTPAVYEYIVSERRIAGPDLGDGLVDVSPETLTIELYEAAGLIEFLDSEALDHDPATGSLTIKPLVPIVQFKLSP